MAASSSGADGPFQLAGTQLHYPVNAYWLRDAPTGLTVKNLHSATLYLCVLYLSENKQRLVPLTA
jgi:hypothetical protein